VNPHYRLANASLRANRAFPSRPARLSERRNRVSFFRTIMETFLRLGIPVLRRSTLARSARVFPCFSFSSCRRRVDDDLQLCHCRIAQCGNYRAREEKARFSAWKALNNQKTLMLYYMHEFREIHFFQVTFRTNL